MSSWPLVALSDVFEIARGGSPRPIDDYITDDPGGINWIMIGDATEGTKYITRTKKRIRPEGAQRSRTVKPGDFLLTNSMSFGKPYILGTTGCIHDGWLVLSPRRLDVDADFFYHLLGSGAVYAEFKRRASGATVKNLNIDLVKGVKIPLPPLPEQRRIAEILDKADALRADRRAVLAQFDTLTQSIFLDMFGDPVANSKRLPIAPMGVVCDVRDGTHDSPKYVSEGGYPLVTSKNVTGGTVDLSDVNYISEADYLQINKRSKVDRGDIILPMIGTIGSPVLVDHDPSYAIKNVALIKFNSTSPAAVFVHHLLSGSYFDFIVGQKNRGGTQKFVSLGDLRAFPIPLPSIVEQQEFVHRIQAVNKVRTTNRNAELNLNALFASLEDRAFRGEL